MKIVFHSSGVKELFFILLPLLPIPSAQSEFQLSEVHCIRNGIF